MCTNIYFFLKIECKRIYYLTHSLTKLSFSSLSVLRWTNEIFSFVPCFFRFY